MQSNKKQWFGRKSFISAKRKYKTPKMYVKGGLPIELFHYIANHSCSSYFHHVQQWKTSFPLQLSIHYHTLQTTLELLSSHRTYFNSFNHPWKPTSHLSLLRQKGSSLTTNPYIIFLWHSINCVPFLNQLADTHSFFF